MNIKSFLAWIFLFNWFFPLIYLLNIRKIYFSFDFYFHPTGYFCIKIIHYNRQLDTNSYTLIILITSTLLIQNVKISPGQRIQHFPRTRQTQLILKFETILLRKRYVNKTYRKMLWTTTTTTQKTPTFNKLQPKLMATCLT